MIRRLRHRKRLLLWIGAALASAALFPLLWKGWVGWYYGGLIYGVSDTPPRRVAIVFGAAIYSEHRLSSVLRDRMETAIALYEAGIVQKLLVSGDNRFETYDEPTAMMRYAIQRGVPEEDIQPDFGGRRTYDTCYRAHHIFQVQSAVLVTQDFHLPRALFTCNGLGLDAVGTSADLRPYRDRRWYSIRETAATLVALWDVIRGKPAPVLGEPIPIE